MKKKISAIFAVLLVSSIAAYVLLRRGFEERVLWESEVIEVIAIKDCEKEKSKHLEHFAESEYHEVLTKYNKLKLRGVSILDLGESERNEWRLALLKAVDALAADSERVNLSHFYEQLGAELEQAFVAIEGIETERLLPPISEGIDRSLAAQVWIVELMTWQTLEAIDRAGSESRARVGP